MPLKVSKEDFIRIWEASKTRAEAAETMGLLPESCTNRARNYRRSGLKLKHFLGRNQKVGSSLIVRD